MFGCDLPNDTSYIILNNGLMFALFQVIWQPQNIAHLIHSKPSAPMTKLSWLHMQDMEQ